MEARRWVYERLTTYDDLVAEIGGLEDPRVFGKKSMTSSVENTPYIVFKMGNSTAEGLTDDYRQDPERQYFQVWIHDYSDNETGDYLRIDRLARLVKDALHMPESIANLWTCIYLETSQDLNDDTLNTVFRYLRFQLIQKEI